MDDTTNLEKIRRKFLAADLDQDGKLSRVEFSNLLKSFRIELKSDEFSTLFKQADTDLDGFVSFQEFTKVFTGKQLQKAEEPRSWKRTNSARRGSAPPVAGGTLGGLRGPDSPMGFRGPDSPRSPDSPSLNFPTPIPEFGNFQELKPPEVPRLPRRKSDEGARMSLSANSTPEIPRRASDWAIPKFESQNKMKSSVENLTILENNMLHKQTEEQKGEPKMTEKQVSEYCSYFWSSDGDCDGKLSKEEFGNMIEALGMNLKRFSIEKAFSIADANQDGSISFSEFVSTYLNSDNTTRVLSHQQILDIFRRHDQKGQGYLTKAAILEVMKSLGNKFDERKLSRMITVIDANGDGRISLEEFCDFLDV